MLAEDNKSINVSTTPGSALPPTPPGRIRAIVYANIDPLTGQRRYLKEIADSYADAQIAVTRLQRQVDQEVVSISSAWPY